MIDDDEIVEVGKQVIADLPPDVTGQPGGPSPEEQALVDQEQAELVARLRAEQAPILEAEQNARDERYARAMAAANARKDLESMVRALAVRVEALEASDGSK